MQISFQISLLLSNSPQKFIYQQFIQHLQNVVATIISNSQLIQHLQNVIAPNSIAFLIRRTENLVQSDHDRVAGIVPGDGSGQIVQ